MPDVGTPTRPTQTLPVASQEGGKGVALTVLANLVLFALSG